MRQRTKGETVPDLVLPGRMATTYAINLRLRDGYFMKNAERKAGALHPLAARREPNWRLRFQHKLRNPAEL
jgi:hypothetical protein